MVSMSMTTTLPSTEVKTHKKSKEKIKHKHKDKKRKEAPTGEVPTLERVKKKSKSAKGKEKATYDQGGEFIKTTSSLDLSLPPYYTNSPLTGAINVLDGLVMRCVNCSCFASQPLNCHRYVPNLSGVLLSHSNIRFGQRTALIQPETPFMKCSVTFDCVVWSPRIGMKLSTSHSFLCKTIYSIQYQRGTIQSLHHRI